MASDDVPSLDDITWLNSKRAAGRLGITVRTLYRLIDEDQVPGYRMGRVIRLKQHEVDAFAETTRIRPGDLSHLYQESSEDSGQGGSSA
jgi:excisionase family DNA binding protein